MSTIEQQAAELAKLKGKALHAKYHEVLGAWPKSNNRPYLIRKILQATQARLPAEPPVAIAAAEAAPKRKQRERDPRIPPAGTILERELDGKSIKVKVLEEGFSYKGKTWRSLSAIAKDATGTVWNGLLFFNLTRRTEKLANRDQGR